MVLIMEKTKKMTIKYWSSLSEGSKERALKSCFPIHEAIVKMLLNDKPSLKDPWWQMVFKRVKIPADTSHYKTVVNGWYMC